jgi:hypothetical protein
MTTKICSKCRKRRQLRFFSRNKAKKDGYQNQCKDCHREYTKLHYQDNSEKYRDRLNANRNKRRIKFFTWLKTKHCIECGEQDFRVLEFDHRDPAEKSFIISEKIADLSFETLNKEIEKCDILCANCHRKRTATQLNWYQFLD